MIYQNFVDFVKVLVILFLNKFDFIEILSILSKFVGFYQNCVFLYKSCLLYINFLDFINKKNC